MRASRLAALVLVVAALAAGSLLFVSFADTSTTAADDPTSQVRESTSRLGDVGLLPARADRDSQLRRGDRDTDGRSYLESLGLIAALCTILGVTLASRLHALRTFSSVLRALRSHPSRAPPRVVALLLVAR